VKNYIHKPLGIFPIAVCLLLLILANHAGAAVTNLYFDVNGATTGSGVANNGSYSWESSFWSTAVAGNIATTAWGENNFPEFSAGADPTVPYTVTSSATHTVAGMLLRSNANTVTIAGADLNITSVGGVTPTGAAGGVQQGWFSSGLFVISNRLTGPGGIYDQTGQIFLNNSNNNYAGGTTLNAALINWNSTGSFGPGLISINGSGGAFIAEANNLTNTNSVNLQVNNASVNFTATTTPATQVWNGPMTLNANTLVFGVGGGTANVVNMAGVISGTGGIGRQVNAAHGTLILSGNNTYTGKSTLQDLATSVTSLNSVTSPAQQASSSLGKPSSAANGTLSIGATTTGATLIYTGVGETTDRILDLSGTTGGATVENDGSGPITFTSANTASGAGSKTLTLQGSNTGANTISGKIVDNSAANKTSLTKAQAGNWTLSGVNTFTGNMTVSGGTLTIGGSGQLNSGSYAGTIADTTTLIYASSAAQTLSGAISGAGGKLTQNGSGTLTLNAAESYTGATTINGGTLALGASGSLAAGTSVTIASGATFDVSGLGASATYTLGTSASLTGIGTATPATIKGGATGTVSLGSQAINLSFTPTLSNGDPTHPALNISAGTLSLNGNTFNVTNASANVLDVGNYTLGTQASGNISSAGSYTLNLSGPGLAPNTSAAIAVSGNTVLLQVTPGGGNTNTYFSNLAPSQSAVYGTLTATVSGTISAPGPIYPTNGDTVSIGIAGVTNTTTINDGTGDFTVNVPINTLSAGPHVVTYAYAGDTNVGTTPTVDSSTAVTITKAPATVTATAQSKTYGQSVATGAGNTNFNSSGLQNSEAIGSVTLAVSGSGAATNGTVAGSPYIITPSAATGGTFSGNNYTITYVTNALTVNPAPLTVTASNLARNYGATNPILGVIYTGFVNNQTRATSDLGGSPALTTAATTNSPIGAYDITNTIGTLTSTNYSFVSFVDGTLTINPLPVNLTGTRPYDGTNDADSSILTITTNYDGTNLTLSGSALLASANAGLEPISDFSGLTLNGTAATNYSLTGASGSVTITTLPLTITANAQSKNYGQALSLGNSAFTVGSGLFGSEQVTAVTLSSPGAAANASVAGSPYVITPSAATGINGFLAGNYAIAYVTNSLTVSAVPLSVTANNQSKTYGQNVAFGSGSGAFTSMGLSNSETIGSVTLSCGGGVSNAPVSGSPYAITPSAATGGTFSPGNYIISYNPGLLTVNPAVLTVTANDASVPYGTTNTTLTATYSNFVAGETLGTSDVGGSPALTSSGLAPNSPIGTYVIANAIGTLTSTNYTFNLVTGTLTVTTLPVNLTGTRPYDGTNDADSSILTIANDIDGTNVTLSGSALLAGSAAGAEAISDFSGLSLAGTASTNYTLSNATGSVTITGAPLSITAYSTNKTYGTAITLDPTGFTVGAGLVGSETVTSVTQASGGAAAGAGVSGSPYAITPSAAVGNNGFLAANYNITYNAGALTVNPLVALLTGMRPYDGTASAAAGILMVANVVGSDDVNLASGSGTLASGAVGTNAITSLGTLALGGTTAPDYTLSGATGSVVVSNPHTPFSILSSKLDNTHTNLVIVYQTVPGVVYQMLSSPSITALLNTWTNEGPQVTAVGTLTTNVVPVDPTGVIKSYVVQDVR
jgi:autotransporter-associated beta strand protein